MGPAFAGKAARGSGVGGHSIEDTGEGGLVFLEFFAAPEFQAILLNKQLGALPRRVVVAHGNPKPEPVEEIPAHGNPVPR